MSGGASELNWQASKKWLETRWPIADAAAMAIFLEASALKAGNVTPLVSFHDMDHSDFLVSGLALRPVFEQHASLSVGQLVWQSIAALKQKMTINTTLGTVLLLAPLAKAVQRWQVLPDQSPATLLTSLQTVLNELSEQDAHDVYAAIRLAKPGGLGRAAQHDVQNTPPVSLIEAMRIAAPIDAVARQYTNGFSDVLERLVLWLQRGLIHGKPLGELIVEIQLRWMAEQLDGLIVRKAGREVALEAQQLAGWALDEWCETGQRGVRWQALDTFLRSGDHTRNPGTTADLIAAALFVLLTTISTSET